jgi:LSD1 subclass zinc finger protein
VVVRERRQVHELPPVRLLVTEHQALHVRCPACQAVTADRFPVEVPSRVQYGPRLPALVAYLLEQQLVPYVRVRRPSSVASHSIPAWAELVRANSLDTKC